MRIEMSFWKPSNECGAVGAQLKQLIISNIDVHFRERLIRWWTRLLYLEIRYEYLFVHEVWQTGQWSV